jgi:hypothetical protein
MDLKQYFEQNKGLGVLATADAQGKVDAAIYARPHVIDEKTVAFIMRDHLTYANIKSNPKACYLFRQDSTGYVGKRLYLTMTREETDMKLIESLSRRNGPQSEYDESKKYLVYFKIDNIRPLLGDA